MLMTQCELGRGNVRMVTWLPYDKRVRIGTVISLDRLEDRWTVLNKSEPVNPEESPIMHGWSVGGL